MAISELPWATEGRTETAARTFVFPSGLPGFEHLRRFKLSTDPGITPPFQMLTAEEEPSIGFYLVDPVLIEPNYEISIPEADEQALAVREGDELITLVIVTIGPDPSTTTVNLLAPVILNLTSGLGRQAILDNSTYSIRTPLAPADAS